MTFMARISVDVRTRRSPTAAVGSMIPIPRLSFQWLACQPSPKFTPVENEAILVWPLSSEKYLSRLSAVQSGTPPAVFALSVEYRNRSRGLTYSNSFAAYGPAFGGLL